MTNMPRNQLPSTRREMIAMMQHALTGSAAGQASIDDEQLVMLATGRIDEIPQPQRNGLLLAISEDRDLADLLSQLAALELEPDMIYRPESAPQGVTRHRLHMARFSSFVRVAWAASIILLVGLLAWRIGESGAVKATDSMPGQIQPSDLTVSQSNWGVSGQTEAASGLLVGLDIAMLVVLVICFVLAVAAFWPWSRSLQSAPSRNSDEGHHGD